MSAQIQITSHLTQLRRQVDELNCHKNIRRTPISTAANQLMSFVMENETKDFLVVKPSDNPFKPKSSCLLF